MWYAVLCLQLTKKISWCSLSCGTVQLWKQLRKSHCIYRCKFLAIESLSSAIFSAWRDLERSFHSNLAWEKDPRRDYLVPCPIASCSVWLLSAWEVSVISRSSRLRKESGLAPMSATSLNLGWISLSPWISVGWSLARSCRPVVHLLVGWHMHCCRYLIQCSAVQLCW